MAKAVLVETVKAVIVALKHNIAVITTMVQLPPEESSHTNTLKKGPRFKKKKTQLPFKLVSKTVAKNEVLLVLFQDSIGLALKYFSRTHSDFTSVIYWPQDDEDYCCGLVRPL